MGQVWDMSVAMARAEWDINGASRLKAERVRLRMTQDDLAKAIGADRKSVGRWESADTAPGAPHLAGMAKEGMDVEWILVGAAPEVSEDHGTYVSRPAMLDLAGLDQEAVDALTVLVSKIKGVSP